MKSTEQMSDTPDWIVTFMRAVYPDAPNLAIASFNEKKVLTDASEKIASLERSLAAAQARADELNAANTSLAMEAERLKSALRFYAHGQHIVGFDTWEGPSGDENWLCPPPKDFSDYQEFIDDLEQHMIEDGSVARVVLSGKELDWEGEEPKEHPCEPVMQAIAEAEDKVAPQEGER